MTNQDTVKKIKKLAINIRRDVVNMIGGEGHVGHLGGSCSSADIVAALYGHKMKFDPKNPQWEGRDKFIYSKGHAAIAQYAALAETGYFPVEELSTCKKLGSRLQGHPDRCKTPGIEAGTGSLGQGLSIANGMALAMRLDKKDNKVYCIMGDGEMDEGQIWEAAMAAASFKIDNIVGIIDKNCLQATGACADRFNTDPLSEKWKSFGWHVIEIDGHNVEQILAAFDEADTVKGMPTVIIAHTIKGKGISFAENVVGFHNGSLTKEQYETALKELDSQFAAL
ncbi:transketolase [Caproiciproducens faecalis]|uniref:Transketolase n=1 Tax=Caproiciproducens faecalis TaxID=2820301 RepID=A0ABS7DLW7_9FIRM|nr:transketolase [Caproiciproducens faecalis]MBW7572057.1 transketolase [Caproiciproducens faecalis]